MPPNKRIQKSVPLELECEWGSCQETFGRMEELCQHAEEAHLADAEEDEAEQSCLWRHCGFCSVDGPEELRRHVFFHCYHTKLKQWGLQVLSSNPSMGSCSIGYQNRNIIPEIPDNFTCLWEDCEQPPYENPEWFYRHVELHSLCMDIPTGDSECLLRCAWKECEACAKGRPKLREHLRSHTQEKVVACPGCGAMYANNTKFFDHIKRQSALEGQRFQCSHCSKRFATERLLRDHMRTHVNHYKCPLCDMTCPSPSSLRNHIKFRHSNERPYSCEYCEYSCKNLVDLRKHLDTHTSEPAYRCDAGGCTYTARTVRTMKIHYKREHEGDFVPRYKCHVCDQCFTRGNNLTVHLRKKHQFKWPSGHPRFRYKEHEDGFMRLQLIRYESVELTEQLMRERHGEDEDEEEEEEEEEDEEEEDEEEEEEEDTAAAAMARTEHLGLGQGASAGAAGGVPEEMEVQLRGVLLEEEEEEKERGPEEQVGLEGVALGMGAEEDQAMFYVLTGGLTPEAEDTVMLQLQDTATQLGMHVV